jgi:hypothetical protein
MSVAVIGLSLVSVTTTAGAQPTPAEAKGAQAGSWGMELAAAGWSTVPSPNPEVQTVTMAGVSCVSSSFCEAVGSYDSAFNGLLSLVEGWNGTDWTVQNTPDIAGNRGGVTLAGVSCVSTSFCEAVGSYTDASGHTVSSAEGWNGTKWAAQSTPNPKGNKESALKAVSCDQATFCEAVGSYVDKSNGEVTLAEGWNGTDWSAETSANPGGNREISLSGVSCPSVTSCEAVGDSFSNATRSFVLLAEVWNGTDWAVQTIPNPAGYNGAFLNGVSCPSATSCEAVGYYQTGSGAEQSLAEVRSGTDWVIQNTADPTGSTSVRLYGVSCVSGVFCEAAGDYSTGHGHSAALVQRWEGTAWTIQTTADPPGSTQVTLYGVSCLSVKFCETLGDYAHGSDDQSSLAEGWNGTAWAVQSTVSPKGNRGASLDGMSCGTATSCEAVDGQGPFAEGGNGTHWVVQTTPIPSGGQTVQLSGVSCRPPGPCEAVGDYQDSSGEEQSLAEDWNGNKWALQTVPEPRGASAASLAGVSCASADSCEAVGTYNSNSGEVPFAEGWTGKQWTLQTVPVPAGASDSYLLGVSCAGHSCEAVGDTGLAPFAAGWNGTAWAVQTTPDPGASFVSLAGVSCRSATSCEAVGTGINDSNSWFSFAEVWNGTAWATQTVPDPTGTGTPFLGAVSCLSASSCEAVGYYDDNGLGTARTLAEVWNGTKWTVQVTPNPTGTEGAGLEAVSCVSGTCDAAGYYRDNHDVAQTLVEQRVDS